MERTFAKKISKTNLDISPVNGCVAEPKAVQPSLRNNLLEHVEAVLRLGNDLSITRMKKN